MITTWLLHSKGVVIITHNRDDYLSLFHMGPTYCSVTSSISLPWRSFIQALFQHLHKAAIMPSEGGVWQHLLEVTSSDLSELLFSYFPLCLCEWLVLNDCPMESGHSECTLFKSEEEPAAALSLHPEHAPPTLRLSFWLIPNEIKCPSARTLLAAEKGLCPGPFASLQCHF